MTHELLRVLYHGLKEHPVRYFAEANLAWLVVGLVLAMALLMTASTRRIR